MPLPTDTLVFYDDLPTTLNPLYGVTDADLRAATLIFDTLIEDPPYA